MEHTKLRSIDDGVSTAMCFVSVSHSKDILRHRELQRHRGGKPQTPRDVNNVRGPSHTSTQKKHCTTTRFGLWNHRRHYVHDL